ncbi:MULTISPECIES: DUF6973 domain-containing protein [Lysinibacillus]|jgi:hypothetical protein|uniref:DUF6973 domain-containing protein n=1 Tax=Lysinibacillus TaxID=400634 RepID=UPI0004D6B5E3|nr:MULTISPECIES: hypothetical protein [Lysinibacillus]AJK87912.1 hypothetical protein HR49_12545 [Lysinibacillus fusiformis]KHK50862.1 hypothetical protein PI85_16525 [Lysinibacillus sp. A1]MCE4042572.1 hypothetical protein [Lysinibacillus fusiformis]UXJ71015.1 hypothetical protein N5069_10925 [Lysinibacillus fusiformis]
MKKYYFSMIFTLLFILSISESTVFASDNSLSIDEEFITKDPLTGKYSNDWSHLDNPENFQLQKDVQNYFSSIQPSNLNHTTENQLNSTQDIDVDELNERINAFLSQIDPDLDLHKSNEESVTITPYSSYGLPNIDSVALKTLEGKLHLSNGVLSPSEIAAAFQNSNGARDHAIRYAKDKNFYKDGVLKTWDNASDALRHFSWNFMNSNDIGVNKARVVGDIHEVALIALDHLNNNTDNAKLCRFEINCMQSAAVRSANADWNSSKNSLSFFNKTFNNASIMDLLNNSKGRQAYSQGYSNYAEPFNIMINNGTLIQFETNINSSLRSTAWQGFK